MAQNWNVKQALAAINKGNKEAITDIGRRFPLTLSVLSMLKGNDAAEELVNAIPDHITTRKIEVALKDGIQVDDSDNDVEESEAKEETTKENKATAGTEYDSMGRVQLRDLIRNAGGEKKCREEFGWAKREQLLAYIEKYGLEGSDDDAEESDDTEEAGPYDGKNAMELFKECKKRGIKAAPKKPAKYYVDLLTKDDAKNDTSDEGDDWDDGEEEEEKPAKKEAPKATVKKAAKPKKEEPEDDGDDDDDWNI